MVDTRSSWAAASSSARATPIVAYVARLHPDGPWKRDRVQGDRPPGSGVLRLAWVRSQAWAVGPGAPVRTLHLDGRRWRMEDAPLEGALYSVTGSIRDGVWAVGDTDAAPMRLAMRWDGSQWARVDTDGQGELVRCRHAVGRRHAVRVGAGLL